MGRKGVDLTQQQFGPWTALESVGTNRHGQKEWRVRCRCGAENVMTPADLKRAAGQQGCAVCSPVRKNRIRAHAKAQRLADRETNGDDAQALAVLANPFLTGRPLAPVVAAEARAHHAREGAGTLSYDYATPAGLLAQRFICGGFTVDYGGDGEEGGSSC